MFCFCFFFLFFFVFFLLTLCDLQFLCFYLVGYNNYADQSAGYHQQQYYDPQQGPNHAGGYGRGSQITQRGGYYGGQ